jgi:uncharacterized protein YjbI with pentapeptide repeats
VDDDDYKHVLSGSNDLAGCVLDGADFTGVSLKGRIFSQAKLKAANFSGADLEDADFRGATVTSVIFENANLRRAKFNGAVFGINFSGANLTDSEFQGIILRCDFSRTNLMGANFTGVHIKENCVFDNALVSDATKFDGAQVLRPYSRLPAFRNYRLERGVLHRIPQEEIGNEANERLRSDALVALSEGLRQVSAISAAGRPDGSGVGIGHNSPPPEFQLSEAEIESALDSFSAASDSLLNREDDPRKLQAAAKVAGELALKAFRGLALNWT